MSKILFAEQNGVHVLKFVGDVRVALGPTIHGFLDRIGQSKNQKSIVIDLNETTNIDSTSLGLLAKIALKSSQYLGAKPTLVTPNEDITRVILSMGFEQIFVIIDKEMNTCDEALELPTSVVSEAALREQVLEAHKTLMSLNECNEACFCTLVEALEAEKLNDEAPARAARG